MPQPLSRVIPTDKPLHMFIDNTPNVSMKARPNLALLVADVVASWTSVESFMLRVFIELMGGHAETAATVFLALEAQTAKAAAINAVAEEQLSDDHRKLLRAILAVMRTHQKTRDKIVHWTWGYAEQLPDALLLVNPKDLLIDVKTLAERDPRNFRFPDYNKVYVYTSKDFNDAIQANYRLAQYASRFRFILIDHPGNKDGSIYAELCKAPEIQERLNRQASTD
jgi:hypothetical protein